MQKIFRGGGEHIYIYMYEYFGEMLEVLQYFDFSCYIRSVTFQCKQLIPCFTLKRLLKFSDTVAKDIAQRV